MRKLTLALLTPAATLTALAVPALAQQPAVTEPIPATGTIVINEIESNGDPVGDWVELANTDPNNEADVSGYTLIDDDPDHTPITLPAGTTIESGGYLAIYTDLTDDGFGLGGSDQVTLADATGTAINSVAWDGHAATSYGRLPDMTGQFALTGEPTRALANVAETEIGAETPGAPLPCADVAVTDLKVTGRFAADFAGEDFSGVDFDAAGRAFVVNNDAGYLYVLYYRDGELVADARYTVVYPDGSGILDAEGVTVAADGAVYIATERDNSDGTSNQSRPSVVRVELPDSATEGTVRATTEWNLANYTGEIAANGGLEAIEQLADGSFAVGVEATGDVLFVSLNQDGTTTLNQRFESAFPGVMALDYDGKTLQVLCDEACGGRSQLLTRGEDGTWADDGKIYARPTALRDLANEGFAAFTDGTGSRYLWADDGVTDGVSLRGAFAPAPAAPASTPSSLSSLSSLSSQSSLSSLFALSS